MKAFTATITALMLAIHAALGCCWHHGHSHGSRCEGAVAKEHSCPHDHAGDHRGHGHDGDDHEAPVEESPCGGECDEGACVFLAGGKPVTPDYGEAAPSDIFSASSGDAAFSWKAVGVNPVPLALPPPLRSHLAKRVLLI